MKIICADIWHSLGAGQPNSVLIGSGSPWAAVRMLSSGFCISGLTGLSHPICLVGPDQVLHKPSAPWVGFSWALYIQTAADLFPRKINPILILQCSEDLVPPWPCCKGLAAVPSAETSFILCHGADPHLGEPPLPLRLALLWGEDLGTGQHPPPPPPTPWPLASGDTALDGRVRPLDRRCFPARCP